MAQYMTYDTTVDSDIWYFNAPKAVISGPAQAGKAIFAQAAIFWGFAEKSSGAKLPFHGMRQDFAAL
jgi:hypothetical protein